MENLPVEVISHILKYLTSIKDRKVCSLVCKTWYEAYLDPFFRQCEVLYISEDNSFQALLDLKNKERKFFHLSIKNVEINESSLKFWERYGANVRTLSIVSCDVREKIFVRILKICNRLEALCIRSCRELFMVGHLLEDVDVRLSLKENVESLNTLDLSYNRYLSDATFSRFVLTFPNIEKLILSGCQISFFSGLYKKFYPDGQPILSGSIFTFPIILNYLRSNSKLLKHLSFSDTLIDNAAICYLSQIKDLQLNSLNLRGCFQLSHDGMLSLSNYQKSLTELDVSMCPRITDVSMLAICSSLTNLISLSVQNCQAITDLGISAVVQLNKLSSLNISECDSIEGEGIIKGICTKMNPNFSELYLSHLGNMTENVVIALSKSLPNLRTLDLGYCYNAVTNKSVQSIIENNCNLKTLILTMCEKLNDSGITGIGLKLPMNNEKKSEKYRFFLGSKTECEIIREAKFEQEIQEICENSSDFSGFSLKNLRGLQNLNLSGCSGISDISLIHAFKFNELRQLNLSRCNKVTEEGLKHLSVNNPTIELLNLELCQNIDNNGVLHVVKNLKRLETLVLGSNKITNSAARILADHGGGLTYLDVRNCNQISSSAINEIFMGLPHLKNFHFTSCKFDDSKIPKPPKDKSLWSKLKSLH